MRGIKNGIQKGARLMTVTLPPKGRDLRLDLIRGIANWQIFINHIPNNIFNWVTTRYGPGITAADHAAGLNAPNLFFNNIV
jgi:hypothetical protein